MVTPSEAIKEEQPVSDAPSEWEHLVHVEAVQVSEQRNGFEPEEPSGQ